MYNKFIIVRLFKFNLIDDIADFFQSTISRNEFQLSNKVIDRKLLITDIFKVDLEGVIKHVQKNVSSEKYFESETVFSLIFLIKVVAQHNFQ